jgi:hypothetical protein
MNRPVEWPVPPVPPVSAPAAPLRLAHLFRHTLRDGRIHLLPLLRRYRAQTEVEEAIHA